MSSSFRRRVPVIHPIMLPDLHLGPVAFAESEAASSTPTIAHEVLDLESQLRPIEPVIRKLLEDIIAEAVRLITPPSAERLRSAKYCLETLRTMDRILVRRNFIFPGGGSLVTLLSDALVPCTLSPHEFAVACSVHSNYRRLDYMKKNQGGTFYQIDCDTSSVVYLAVAEKLGLPCCMVELPGHNFVRWRLRPDHFNWDTNLGMCITDKEYLQSIPTPLELVGKNYLADMQRDWVLGYWRMIRGQLHDRAGRYKQAAADLQASASMYPVSGNALNLCAWFLATCPDAAYRSGTKAVAIAQQAVQLKKDPEWLDTLAAAYAEAHDWDNAVSTEKLAKQLAVATGLYPGSGPEYDKLVALYESHHTYAESPLAPHSSAT